MAAWDVGDVMVLVLELGRSFALRCPAPMQDIVGAMTSRVSALCLLACLHCARCSETILAFFASV